MIIDFEKIKRDRKHQEINEKLEAYSHGLRIMLDQIDQILNDIEMSGINWFEANIDQKEKIEAISTIGLFMETYAGWSKE
jgi:hypothetical protein